MWLGPMREKRAAAEREEQRAADLKKVKHDSAQPKPILSTLHLQTSAFHDHLQKFRLKWDFGLSGLVGCVRAVQQMKSELYQAQGAKGGLGTERKDRPSPLTY